MDEIVIDPGFRETVFRRQATTPAYEEYRRKWNENPKNGTVEAYPLNLDVEVTNRCNLRCPFCVREYDNEGTGYMSLELFRRICKEVKGKVPAMKLNWRGEPTLHPNLAEFVRLAKRAKVVEVMFNTNGTVLDAEMAEKLIAAGVDKVIFSIDSIRPERYREMRKGGELDDALINLHNLLKLREEAGSETPHVRVQKIDFPSTRGEDYVGFFRDMGVDSVAVNTYKEKNPDKLAGSEWRTVSCAQPFQRMFVTWRGEYRVCCQGQLFPPLGNAETMSVHEAWHSPLMTEIRRHHAKGEGYRVPQCATCETTKLPK